MCPQAGALNDRREKTELWDQGAESLPCSGARHVERILVRQAYLVGVLYLNLPSQAVGNKETLRVKRFGFKPWL